MHVGGETFDPKKFLRFLNLLKTDLNVSTDLIMERVLSGLYDGLTVQELLTFTAESVASLSTQHPDYSVFGGRVAVKALYRTTPKTFSEAVDAIFTGVPVSQGTSQLSPEFHQIVMANRDRLDKAIKHERDKKLTFFGFQTLSRSYLIRIEGKIIERPQYLLMRAAVGIHGEDIDSAIETYDLMSRRFFIHATPTLFNAGTRKPQLSSCFLVAMKDDSIEGIFETLSQCAKISKHAGGIGLHVSNIRSRNAYINGTNGQSSGLVPMLRVFNNMARYVDQGGNKRPGAISITLEPWHADVFDFLELRKNHGKEEYRARDLFYALWIPDLFMKTVEEDGTWYLFSPDTAPGLSDVYGKDFEDLYRRYVSESRFVEAVPAQKLWMAILDAQIETGMPSMLYKDACNAKSNQKNLGTIKSSNLCTEIVEYSDPNETAACNLASIGLPSFINNGEFDFDKLHQITKVVTKNLNLIIDRGFYPDKLTKRSNLRHRPIAIGVQGLTDVYQLLKLNYDSDEACKLNEHIFETIYHGALEKSMEIARENGKPYESYEGSPISQGKFQFDLWPSSSETKKWDWELLRQEIAKHGVANSLVTAIMPTASTSQILGFTECIEPVTSNIYSRRVLSGEFQVVNPHLVNMLEPLGLWTPPIRAQIIASNGSVQRIKEIPDDIKDLFRTVWELSQRALIDQAATRGRYIDHSQSMNLFLRSPNRRQLSSMHFYAWKQGLKTGIYYLRSAAAAAPIPVTIEVDVARSASVQPDFKRSRPSTPQSCDICSG